MSARPVTILRKFVFRYGSLVFLILMWVVLSLTSPQFFTLGNAMNILLQVSVLGIIAMGMTFTMLTAGIDLSVGSVIAFTSALAAGFAAQASTLPGGTYGGQALPPILAIAFAIAIGGVLGVVNGVLIVNGGLPPFVATLAMLAFARGLTLVYTGGYVIPAIQSALTFLGSGQIGPVPVPGIVMFLLFVLLWFILTQTRLGLHIYAVGGNEETTRLAGVNTNTIKVITYVVSGLMAGIGGVIFMGRLNSAQPQVAVGIELDAIAAPVLGGVSLFGGVGNLQGALIGTFIIGTLSNGMTLLGTDPYVQQVIKGLVFVAAVAWDFYTKRK
jgi:ribose transport system permease protein